MNLAPLHAVFTGVANMSISWATLISAIFGAVVGGLFLLFAEWRKEKIKYRNAARIVFLSFLDNIEKIDGFIKSLDKPLSPAFTHPVFFYDLKCDAYFRHEETLAISNSFHDIAVLRTAVDYVAHVNEQLSMVRIKLPSEPQLKQLSKEILLNSQNYFLDGIQILSKALTHMDRKKFSLQKQIKLYRDNLDRLQNAQDVVYYVYLPCESPNYFTPDPGREVGI